MSQLMKLRMIALPKVTAAEFMTFDVVVPITTFVHLTLHMRPVLKVASITELTVSNAM